MPENKARSSTTGLSFETILGVRRHEVDLQNRRIIPSTDQGTKVRQHHDFGLDPDTYDSLREHVIAWDKERYALGQDTPMLFVWSNGQQLDAASASRMFQQHCANAGVPVVSIDQMRVAYAMAALESGIPTKVIRERLGRDTEPRWASVVPLRPERMHHREPIHPGKSDHPAERAHDQRWQTRHASHGRRL